MHPYLNAGGGLPLERALELSEGHGEVRALREELAPLRDVGVEQRLVFVVRQDALLRLLDEVQDILRKQGFIDCSKLLLNKLTSLRLA